MALRFIAYTRVGMQRAGLLLAACEAADDRQPADADRVASRTATLVQRAVPIPPAARVNAGDYLSSLRLWNRYGQLQGRALTDEDLMEVQDLWLADPDLRSATGALTVENAAEMPQLAVSLRLLRDGTFTRTDRGRALLVAAGRERVNAVRKAQLAPNPLLISDGAQLIVLAALIEADGDFLQSVWKTSSAMSAEPFKRVDFASGMAAACGDLRKRGRRRARSGADQALLARIAKWEEAVGKERKSGSDWGGGRPPDQMATLRLEPFVDLGMIDRLDRYAYRYHVNEEQRGFWGRLSMAADPIAFMRSELVAGWLSASGRSAEPAEQAEMWEVIRNAYESLRSPLGFASFAEVILLAVGQLLEARPPRYFELQDGIDLLKEMRRESPKNVRLGINRASELTYMKLSDAARAG